MVSHVAAVPKRKTTEESDTDEATSTEADDSDKREEDEKTLTDIIDAYSD